LETRQAKYPTIALFNVLGAFLHEKNSAKPTGAGEHETGNANHWCHGTLV
jgi:hypothetical protein